MSTNRRTFLKLLSTSALTASFPASISRALAIPATSHWHDHRHRAHRHPHAGEPFVRPLLRHAARRARLRRSARRSRCPRAKSVWHQPQRRLRVAAVPPGHAPNLGLQFLEDPPHDWTTTHAAWNGGRYDQWVPHKGTTTMAHSPRERHPVPVSRSPTPSRSATPTTARCSARPIPTATTCGRAGSATTARAAARSSTTPRPATTGRRIPSALEARGHLVEDLPGRRRGLDAAAVLGLERGRLHRQLRRQLAALLPPVPERRARQPAATRRAQTRHGHLAPGRLALRQLRGRRARRHAAAGLVDRRARGVHRAPELAAELRRLVRLADARRADREPGGLEQDGVLPHLRRERRLLRPHGAARRRPSRAPQGLSTVDTTNEIFAGNARLRAAVPMASACACR